MDFKRWRRQSGKRASNGRFVRLPDQGQEREAVRRDEARSDVGNLEEGRRELDIEPRVSKDGSSVHNNTRTQSTFTSLSVPNSSASSPFSIGSEDREALQAQQVWKRKMMSVWHAAESHKNANFFLYRITDFSSGYHFKVRKPMNLLTIKKNIKNGEIHTIADFKRDIMVMFTNAILYNSSDHAVFQRSMEMQRDVNTHIKTSFSSLGAKALSRDLNRRRTSPRSQTPEDEEAAEAKIRLMEELHQAAKNASEEHLHQHLDSFNPALRSPSQLAAVQEFQSELPSPTRSGSLKAPVEEDEVPLVTQYNAGCSRKRASSGRFVRLPDKGQEREAVRRDEARSDVGNLEEGRRELDIEPRVSKDGSSVHNNPRTQSTFTSLSVPNSSASSPFSIGSEDREALQAQQVWKRKMMSVWHAAESHKNANFFLHRITNFASGYHSKVRKPMNLLTIKRNIKNGEIHTIADFKRDIMVMFTNAILYNSSDHAVFQISMEMQRDVNKHIKTSFSSLGAKALSRDLNRRTTSPRRMCEGMEGILPLRQTWRMKKK